MLCWVAPDRVIRSVVDNPNTGQDLGAHVITALLALHGMWVALTMVGVRGASDSFFASIAGGAFVMPLTIIMTYVLTWLWHGALEKSKVKDELLRPDMGRLAAGHLHIYAVLMPVLFIASVTGEPIALVILAVVLLRTLDLEARLIRDVCSIPMDEAYKGTVMLLGVYGGIAFAATWLLSRVF
jgi:hypothetical protein